MKKNYLQKLLIIAIGNFLIAAAVMLFISPHGIILGGSTGISLVITHSVHLPLSAVVLVINLILFGIGFVCMGKEFALTTVASTLLYPMMVAILEQIPFSVKDITDNTMLAAVFGGVLMGAGAGLILRTGGSSGGTDVLSLVLQKYLHINLSAALYFVDGCVLAMQMLFSNPEQILYGFLVLALLTLTMNKIMVLGKTQIQMFIISEKTDLIREKIISEEDAGVTLFEIEKGYTHKKGQCIMCVIPRRKLYSMNDMITGIDPQAFVTISEVNEVRGKGFSLSRYA